jgi:hypothetical protein
MGSPRSVTRFAGMLGLVALLVIDVPATASARPGGGRTTVETIVGVLASVSKGRVTIASTAGDSARAYRTDVLTVVCYEPDLCLQSGDMTPLLPGATVRADVAPDQHGRAHASTLFLTSVAATIRVDALEGDVIMGHSTRSDAAFTVVRRPFTIVVDQRGEESGVDPGLQVGQVVYFTGLAGFVNGSPVTIAARLFP